jgi:filamentous hemagglutinin family protein
MKPFVLSAVSGFLSIFAALPAIAQVIPAADGVGTQVIQIGDRVEITGGQFSGDNANLFHSFEAFRLGVDQIADFQVLPSIENVLGRVVGGSGSVIDGVMRVSGGGANLYLIDPAGIVFGENARLDVAGDFVATTATSIGFGDRWLEVMGGNNWASLVGDPSGFGFGGSGAIVNLGELAVEPGQSIGLLGDTVINTGSLSAAGGTVAIVANETGDRLRLEIPGNVLSLEVDREAIHEDATALVLPELLAGAVESAGAIVRNPDGSVRLSSSPINVNPLVGDALVSGVIDVSSALGVGGSALVLGERVGLLAGAIDGSGRDGGGSVNIGGNFQGVGVLPNAELTVVDGGSLIVLDGVVLGDGGRAIVWADGSTRFSGEVLARGGREGGDGGFVEVSGKRFLDFVGWVDTSAVNGEFGTLLLDPTNILVRKFTEATESLVETDDLSHVDEFGDPDIGDDRWTYISSETLNSATSNIELQAENTILILDVNIAQPGVSLTARAGNNIEAQRVTTNGGNIEIYADFDRDTYGGAIVDQVDSNGGDIIVTASRPFLNSEYFGMPTHRSLSNNSSRRIAAGIEAGNIDAGGGDISLFTTVTPTGEFAIRNGIEINEMPIHGIRFGVFSEIRTSGLGDINVEIRDGFALPEGGVEPLYLRGVSMSNADFYTEDGNIEISLLDDFHESYYGISGNLNLNSSGIGNINITSNHFIQGGANISVNNGNLQIQTQDYKGLQISSGGSLQAFGDGSITIGGEETGVIDLTRIQVQVHDGNINFHLGGRGENNTFGDLQLGGDATLEATGSGNIRFFQDPVISPAGVRILWSGGGFSARTQSGNISVSNAGNFYVGRASVQNTTFLMETNGGDILLNPSGGLNIGRVPELNLRPSPLSDVGESFRITTNGGRFEASSGSGAVNVIIGDISTLGEGSTDSGDIVINTPGSLRLGYDANPSVISTASPANAGSISITAGGIASFGVINASGGINGGDISLEANRDIYTETITMMTPGFSGDSGDISLTSVNGSVISSEALIGASALGRGGSIDVFGNNGVYLNEVNAYSFDGVGGLITITSEGDIVQIGNSTTNNNNIVYSGDLMLANSLNFKVEGVTLREIFYDASGELNSPSIFSVEESGNIVFGERIDSFDYSRLSSDSDSPTTANSYHDLIVNAENGSVSILEDVGTRFPLNSFTIRNGNAQISDLGLEVVTEENILVDNLDSIAPISLTSNTGDITTGDITTPAGITLTAPNGNIQARHLSTTNPDNPAGNITIDSGENTTIASANLQSLNDIGGNIRIEAPTGNVRITNSFTDRNGTNASISTAGAIDGGTVYIFHGGGGIIPFVVGNAARNGSAAAITRGLEDENTIAFANYPNLHEQDFEQDTSRLTLDTIPAPIPPEPIPPEPTPPEPTPPAQNNPTPSTNSSSTNEPAQPEIKPDEPELEEPEPLTPNLTNVSTNPPNVTVPSELDGKTTPANEASPVIPSEIIEGDTTPEGEVSPITPTAPASETEIATSEPEPTPEPDNETTLDLNDPIVQLALLIGETIGAETTIGTNPDTGNTEVLWSVPDEDGNIFNIEQTIPTLEPETTISEPVTIAAAPTSTPSEPTLTPSDPASETSPQTPIANNPNPSNNNVHIPNEIEPADPTLDPPADPTPTQNTDTTNSDTNSTTTFVPTNLDATTFDPLALGTPDEIAETIEADLEAEFENDADDDLNDDGDERLTVAQIKETLQGLEAETGRRGAIVYASTIQQNEDGREHVILALVTPYEATIVRTVTLDDDQTLEELVQDFQTQLLDPRARRFDGYKRPAQKLYDILVRPIEDDLDSLDLDLLIYAVDAGLRHIPLAALHDGDQFLIERYSIGSIPSLGLTDTRYRRLREGRALAMGADQFPLTNQAALPAVPFELDAIVADRPTEINTLDPVGIWPGQTFLNEDFTFDNLIKQRNTQPYDIVHLATHASFQGSDAYIELWDSPRSLDEFREAEWYAPPTVELLVLSACQTARGSEEAERGFAGLAVRSGVKSALASLWSVSDIGTLAMMAGFYHALPDVPLKAEAVQAAQLAMLRGEITPEGDAIIVDGRRVPLPPAYHGFSGEFSHPYYWAAFSLVGSPW